jgi:hypothetical protein
LLLLAMIWTEMMPLSRLLAVHNSPTGENGIPTFKVKSDATEGTGDAKLHARLDQGGCLTAGKLWPPLGGPDAGSPEAEELVVGGDTEGRSRGEQGVPFLGVGRKRGPRRVM